MLAEQCLDPGWPTGRRWSGRSRRGRRRVRGSAAASTGASRPRMPAPSSSTCTQQFRADRLLGQDRATQGYQLAVLASIICAIVHLACSRMFSRSMQVGHRVTNQAVRCVGSAGSYQAVAPWRCARHGQWAVSGRRRSHRT